MKLIFIIFINMLMASTALALDGTEYSLIQTPDQKIHIVKIDLNNYDITLKSAHNGVFGREKIGDIAARENASIAINAGFFQIGDNEDGRPTGTLIIDGNLFGLRTTKHAVFALRNQVPSVETWQPSIELELGKTKIIPKKFNKFATNSNIILYSDKWGPTTLTPYKSRKEITINEERRVTNIADHGNNPIPSKGYVLSLPQDAVIYSIKLGDHVTFNNDEYAIFDKKTSAVMGIPFLIMNDAINDDLADTEKHARTAIGVDRDGKIIIVVAECVYTKSLSSLTLKETQGIFQKNNISLNDLKITDVKKLLAKELSNDSTATGLTIKELADLMQELGCTSAIILDGGGSSSLYIDGKYIHQCIGDKDEGEGTAQVRPVSEAIIFKRKAE